MLHQTFIKFIQYSNMIQSIKDKASKASSSISQRAVPFCLWLKRHRGKIIKAILVLATICMIVLLVTHAVRGVGLAQQGVIINYTESQIHDGDYTNSFTLIGLGSSFHILPKSRFLLLFTDDSSSKYSMPAFEARVAQGTKIKVSATLQCQVVVQDLKQFVEQYSLDWHIYPLRKCKNVITQQLLNMKFYELNNTVIVAEVNAELSSYQEISGYPFQMELLSLSIEYGDQIGNDSLGMELVRAKSQVEQLEDKYERVNSRLDTWETQLIALTTRIGQLKGNITKQQQEIQGSREHWGAGVELVHHALGNSSEHTRQYLWLYFQNIYNSTYRQ